MPEEEGNGKKKKKGEDEERQQGMEAGESFSFPVFINSAAQELRRNWARKKLSAGRGRKDF